MKVVRANSRIRFTSEDVSFLTSALGHGPDDAAFLTRLLADPETRDLLLDDPRVYSALLERHHCLHISMQLYFYVVVRKAMLETGVDSRDVADYVASLLSEFSRAGRSSLRLSPDGKPLDYVFEMLAALNGADERTRFVIRAHIGNHTLFLTGLFADRIRHRTNRIGAPDMSYYESIGAASFRQARDHSLARKNELTDVFDRLSTDFTPTRRALNELSQNVLHLDEPRWLRDFLTVSSGQFD